jgi:phosphate starvation-inducible protein PhoH
LSKKTREERRALKKARQKIAWKDNVVVLKNHFSLKEVEPLTIKQCEVFEEYKKGKNLLLYGIAGSGKTFLALYLALKDLEENKKHQKIIIVRSAVPSRDVGFMPGNLKEKSHYYESPYQQICSNLYGRDDAYSILKTKNVVEFITSSYVRGITLDDSIVIVDEIQNFTEEELHSIMTRIGKNSKIVLCGDLSQNDLKKEKTGFSTFVRIFKNMRSFSNVEFGIEDIVRSGLVKEYIITRDKLERDGL